MKAYLMTVLVIDFDNLGADEAKMELEAANYSNDCIAPMVLEIETKDIGQWADYHPLNFYDTDKLKYFKELPTSKK